MDKAGKKKRVYTVLSISSAAIALLAIIPIIIFYVNALYIAMIPVTLLSVAGLYCVVFFSFAAYDAKVCLCVIPVIKEVGCDDYRAIAARIGWKNEATRKFIEKCKKRGYI